MIIKINLLPWREELRLQDENKVKRSLMMSCVVGVFMAAIVAFLVNQELESRAIRYTVIDAELSRLQDVERLMNERKAQTDRLKEQLDILQRLSAQRSEVVGLMEKFALVIPEDAFIVKLAFTLEELAFAALAKDRDIVSIHLDKIDEQIGSSPIPLVQEIDLEGNKFSAYNLKVKPRQNTNK